MIKVFNYISDVIRDNQIRKKIIFTLALLWIYRLLVVIPIPIVDVNKRLIGLEKQMNSDLATFFALFWWALENFSIVAVWLIAYINASIIMQLLTVVVPKLEELQELWEEWQKRIQIYARFLTVPLAYLQSIWMIFFMNYLMPWVIQISTFNVLFWAFVMTVWTVMLMWLGEQITEKGISNWISLIIFASIVSWLTWKLFSYTLSAWWQTLAVFLFITFIVLSLIILSIYLIKTVKEIPITYSRQWKFYDTAILPIPLNPVWMVPMIFAMAFVSFPYMISELLLKSNIAPNMKDFLTWMSTIFNIYSDTPSLIAFSLYFILIVLFTFFYTFIVFSPEKIAENLQKRWWYIYWVRPWEETSKYLSSILIYLSFWWGLWLAFIWVYTYILSYIPLIQQVIMEIWTLPILVSWAWIVIMVWVVNDIINKLNAELAMQKYEKI